MKIIALVFGLKNSLEFVKPLQLPMLINEFRRKIKRPLKSQTKSLRRVLQQNRFLKSQQNHRLKKEIAKKWSLGIMLYLIC
ncbi:MAG: hypothetical protein BWK79_16560 [Beggiatoa sp. IS2]|nr:MAG: hypothetical protein BWK79_16560 [Beggiatoa sp. IS2]